LNVRICDNDVTLGYALRAMFCWPSIVKPVSV
jgi:hypothetical protein